MPRDGSNIYHRPAGTDAVTDTTIESSKYNALVADLEQDANLPRPIVAGGTGATSALAAMVALSGEVAKQGPVTNYDSFPWVNGSFYSNAGATGAPTGVSAFTGLYYEHSNTQYATIEARDATSGSGLKYVRMKAAGVWGSWIADPSTADVALKVSKAGDSMSGDLAITKASPALSLNKTTVATNNSILGTLNGASRWLVSVGNGSAEGGSNTGSDFSIYRYNDVGVFVSEALNINRGSGNVGVAASVVAGIFGTTGTYFFGNSGIRYLQFDGTNFILNGGANLVVNGGTVVSANSATVGTYQFGNSGTKYLQFDGAQYALLGGQLVVNNNFLTSGGNVVCAASATTGAYYFGNAVNGKYLQYDGASYILNGSGTLVVQNFSGPMGVYNRGASGNSNYYVGDTSAGDKGAFFWDRATGNVSTISFAAATSISIQPGGSVQLSNGWLNKQGSAGAYGGSVSNLYYTGSGTQLWIDVSNFGLINVTSDYRIKKDVIDLPGMWDTVKALRPIKYTHKDFTPPAEKLSRAQRIKERDKRVKDGAKDGISTNEPSLDHLNGPMVAGDDIERWGFVAHELQETLVPSASSGVKDSPDHIQSPNPFTVIAALTKALQEAMARIERLEARL
jgi:hypothetical protein